MKEFNIVTPVIEAKFEELTPEQQNLVSLARDMTHNSYAPYSHFHVGAAILLSDGSVVTGSNQENAAFPSGTCAERTAAYYAHSSHPDARFKAIAIAARGTDSRELKEPVAPCGACRQALLEYEKLAGEPVQVLLVSESSIYVLPSVESLLPLCFAEF